jgi:hypothetical protein
VSPTPPPAPGTPTAEPTEAAASPEPTPIRLTGALSDWTVLGRADEGAWSPGSDRILLMAENDVRIVDEVGTVIDRFDADRGAWLDQDHVVLFDAEPVHENDGELFEAVVGSGEMRSIGPGVGWMLGNGLGLLATPAQSNGSTRIWDGSSWVASLDGYPIGWSNDGHYLAIIHSNGSNGPGIEGTLEVYSARDWSSQATAPQTLVTAYPVRFDPGGTAVAFTSNGGTHVLDLMDGTVRAIGPDQTTSFAWRFNGTVLMADRDRTIWGYMMDGTQTIRLPDAGDSVQTSVDGYTSLYYVDDFPGPQRPPLTIIGTDAIDLLDVTGTTSTSPVLAPDGHAVLMQTDIDGDTYVISGR